MVAVAAPASVSLQSMILGIKLNNKVEQKPVPVAVDCLKADRAILEHASQCKGG